MASPQKSAGPEPSAPRRFVSYLRVSTDRQGRSGLGLEAQREAVQRFVAGIGGQVTAEHVEVESGNSACWRGSGRHGAWRSVARAAIDRSANCAAAVLVATRRAGAHYAAGDRRCDGGAGHPHSIRSGTLARRHRQRIDAGETQRSVARSYQVSQATIFRLSP